MVNILNFGGHLEIWQPFWNLAAILEFGSHLEFYYANFITFSLVRILKIGSLW